MSAITDRPLIPRQRTAIDEHQFAEWAWQAHASRCPECAHGDSCCGRGRDLLALTAPTGDPDIPGFPEI